MRRFRKTVAIFAAATACATCIFGCTPTEAAGSGLLRDIYKDIFPIGAAVMPYSLEKYGDILPHFDSITAENSMKWRVTEPSEGKYDYSDGDALVEWAKAHDTAVRGHCLLWYKSLPAWVIGKAADKASALELIDVRVKQTVEHFGSSIYAWDVVNEALNNTVTSGMLETGEIYRTNVSGSGVVDWYALCGFEFIERAFASAAEAREQFGLNFDLYYNDYGLNDPNKREACVRLVERLQSKDIPVDGIGMQAHYKLADYLADKDGFVCEFENSIVAFTELGVDVQITELDIRVYANKDEPQRFDKLPLDVETAQAEMFARLFEVCRRYATPRRAGVGRVTGVTTWGVADANNAQNSAMHREYPLLFSVDSSPKKAYYSIIDF